VKRRVAPPNRDVLLATNASAAAGSNGRWSRCWRAKNFGVALSKNFAAGVLFGWPIATWHLLHLPPLPIPVDLDVIEELGNRVLRSGFPLPGYLSRRLNMSRHALKTAQNA
jgi:hypothetical protein